MNKKYKYGTLAVVVIAFLSIAVWYLHRHYIAVLQPRGTIGHQERNLIIVGLLLAALVVIPVYAMTIGIAWKYRAGNIKARYSPDWDHNRVIEFTWWAIPGVIILIFSIITWNSAHALDPFKPLDSKKKPLNIQVVSLDWKWLFIYPDKDVASVNLLEVPVNVPLNFELTSDSVMNSFWVPALGGQIYTMPGMSTQVHLMATQAGSYAGSSANISGQGFAGMAFTAKAVNPSQFNEWLGQRQRSPDQLNLAAYNSLAKPSQNNPVTYYSRVQNGLYDDIIMKYMAPGSNGMAGMHGE
ncbi:MAG TPA: ubiquinol oxidase subunit II [Candidatus Saccharimonadales bacterium]|nr:ubiquinol oxidase subunit II [Candidatus Saccharimonadales bacterium]